MGVEDKLTLIIDVLEELKIWAMQTKMNMDGRYNTGMMIFNTMRYEVLIEKINNLTDKIAKNGEKITCEISCGWVLDVGQKTLEVVRGSFIELYDYEELSVTFIRLYHYRQLEKEWLALYIDKNLDTPWWTKAERGV